MLLLAPWSSASAAEVLRVPADYGTIQEAVNAASAGDQIRVSLGMWCGATVNKTLDLFGEGGATIIGCSSSPSLSVSLRMGFFLPDGSASGTTIRHFVFDGNGISNTNFDPLSFAVFARDAHNVVVEQNRILGTVQAITNTSGSGWTVNHNVIEGLTLFDCSFRCGGGDGIVFQERKTAVSRQTDNVAMFNVISGAVPDNFSVFSMAGILVLGGQDGTVVQANRIAIPNNTTASAEGQAIVVSDACCGIPSAFSTAINSVIVKNDGRDSEFAVVITKDGGGGNGNSVGTTLRGNFGINDINEISGAVTNRSIRTLVEFP